MELAAGWGGDFLAGHEALVRTDALTKRYGKRVVVNTLNLEVLRGDVFGLLGPNGSGKTTTLRMLLGLARPTSGRIELFGGDVSTLSWQRQALARVGAIVEQPAFYPFLSGQQNLAAVATFAGLPGGAATRARIAEVLEQVGLAARARDAYRKYSLGMKQRLGIAAALLTGPELVLLDEPTNGLDPAGMVEVRALLGHLAQSGTTVFLCSHLLHEVQQVCTRVAILKEGVLLAQGRVGELLRAGSGVQVAFADPADLPRAVAALQSAQSDGASWLQGATYVRPEPGAPPPPGGWYLLIYAPAEQATEINRLLAGQGLYAAELRWREGSLEQFFLALTGATAGPPPSAMPPGDGLPAGAAPVPAGFAPSISQQGEAR
jgi:ABC-2 type transport system ATP-binding protein